MENANLGYEDGTWERWVEENKHPAEWLEKYFRDRRKCVHEFSVQGGAFRSYLFLLLTNQIHRVTERSLAFHCIQNLCDIVIGCLCTRSTENLPYTVSRLTVCIVKEVVE